MDKYPYPHLDSGQKSIFMDKFPNEHEDDHKVINFLFEGGFELHGPCWDNVDEVGKKYPTYVKVYAEKYPPTPTVSDNDEDDDEEEKPPTSAA